MCASCGCGEEENRHGDDRNILWSEIESAAEAADTTPRKVAANIETMALQNTGV